MTSHPRRSLRSGLLLLLVPFALATCGTSVQHIPLDGIGSTAEKPVALNA